VAGCGSLEMWETSAAPTVQSLSLLLWCLLRERKKEREREREREREECGFWLFLDGKNKQKLLFFLYQFFMPTKELTLPFFFWFH
jgi:hypothetical protein